MPTVPQNNPMMVGDDHEYLLPPHSRASSSMIHAGAKSTKPVMSKSCTASFNVQVDFFCLYEGNWMKTIIAMVIAPTGRLIQKHQRHEACSVKAPPISGAMTCPAPAIEMSIPISVGRFAGDAATATMVSAPLMIPEAPIPATARPRMSILLDVANAQIRDPNSNPATKQRKENFRLKYVYTFPVNGCNAALAIVYAAAYQPMSAIVWKWSGDFWNRSCKNSLVKGEDDDNQ